MKKAVLLLLLMVAVAASQAQAKEGFYLGANLLFNNIGGDINDLKYGNGLGLHAGYGLNRYLAFEAGVFKTGNDIKSVGGTAWFKGGTIDAKLTFPLTGSHMEPYIFGGVGWYKIAYPVQTIEGYGGQLGVGVDIYLFPELNLSVGLSRRNINFDATSVFPEKKAKVTTLDIGLTYHFI